MGLQNDKHLSLRDSHHYWNQNCTLRDHQSPRIAFFIPSPFGYEATVALVFDIPWWAQVITVAFASDRVMDYGCMAE
ncbi:hypothetical protein MCOR27_011012 [Pyricularia oryzae]|nr:hypothetical protein MCOR27_011012 [Pyricularia oryzae]